MSSPTLPVVKNPTKAKATSVTEARKVPGRETRSPSPRGRGQGEGEARVKSSRIEEATPPLRSAWIEIDLKKLRGNFQAICQDKPRSLQFVSVIKDEAYGHGALPVAKAALERGASFLALSTVEEALYLRGQGIQSRLLLLGERLEAELPLCLEHNLTCCVNDRHTVLKLAQLAARAGRRVPVHLKINTGMNRYGVRWTESLPLIELICSTTTLILEGVLSHFVMSDETDKTFALTQLERFNVVLRAMAEKGVGVKYRHLANTGGFLDLPQAHFDMVRVGILPLGVYPSQVCRRIPGVEPVMTVKARVAAIQHIQKGDVVGYGMRYQAPSPRRIAVIPVGCGDGYPRLRNQGHVLIRGRRAPIVGGVAMDAFMVDTTDLPEVRLWDEAVLMGRQGGEEISVHDLAHWKNTVSYDILVCWRARLPRVYLNAEPSA